ncbi:MAG: glycosyltransferase [Anaerolineae bacterium]|nr:glycosyltransferase [Anaerolineae bacterium]
MISAMSLSVVTPTLERPEEVDGLLENLAQQTLLPLELILVDGAPPDVTATGHVVASKAPNLPYRCRYIRYGGGTAIQRNVGIDMVRGDFIAFIDDDIRLEADFFEQIMAVFREDENCRVGGVAGYITNQYFDINSVARWRWNQRLRLYSTYEPGRYDFETGYPINRYMQPPHDTNREIDFMGAGCAMWRREVFADGLRFSEFFSGHGVLEDAHLALRAAKQWRLLECGRARCVHLQSSKSREDARMTARKTAVNYRYVFIDIVPKRTWKQEWRFWRVQVFDLFRLLLSALRGRRSGWQEVLGKLEGIIIAFRL